MISHMDIHDLVLEVEVRRRIKWNYMSNVQCQRWSEYQRYDIVNFIASKAEKLGLSNGPVHLAVRILDIYLSACCVDRSEWYLVASTCLWIAAKFLEDDLHVQDILSDIRYTDVSTAYACNKAFQRMVRYEKQILRTLDHRVWFPTTKTFLDSMMQGNMDDDVRNMSDYVVDLSLMHEGMLQFLPSEIAKASIDLSMVLLGRKSMASVLKRDDNISKCITQLASINQYICKGRCSVYNALYDKYKSMTLKALNVRNNSCRSLDEPLTTLQRVHAVA